jgi:hypothetical protein
MMGQHRGEKGVLTMPSRIVLFLLGALLFGAALWFGQMPSGKFTPAGSAAVESAIDRVRATGCFNHPDYPWVVRARLVRGDTLYFVEVLHRRADGGGFDLVGKAVQATVSFSRVSQQLDSDWCVLEEQCDSMLVRVRQLEMEAESGSKFFVDHYVFFLPLPGPLGRDDFLPFAQAKASLSTEQSEALRRPFPLRPEQTKHFVAFGERGIELLQSISRGISERTRTVVAHEGEEAQSDRHVKLKTLGVARFDASGKVVARFLGNDVVVNHDELSALFLDGDEAPLSFTDKTGRKIVLPANGEAK